MSELGVHDVDVIIAVINQSIITTYVQVQSQLYYQLCHMHRTYRGLKCCFCQTSVFIFRSTTRVKNKILKKYKDSKYLHVQLGVRQGGG